MTYVLSASRLGGTGQERLRRVVSLSCAIGPKESALVQKRSRRNSGYCRRNIICAHKDCWELKIGWPEVGDTWEVDVCESLGKVIATENCPASYCTDVGTVTDSTKTPI